MSWAVHDILSNLGYVVLGPVPSVAQALEAIAAQVPDAAVLDVNLRGEMSYPIADALAARGVPFVFSTGYEGDRLAEPYRVFPVLQKPLRQAELGEALAKVLAVPPGAPIERRT